MSVRELTEFILPVLIIGIALFAGMLTERFLLHYLKNLAEKTKWEGDDILMKALRRVVTLWFVLSGSMIAIHNVNLSEANINIIHKILLVLFIFSVTIGLSRVLVGFVEMYTKRSRGIFPSTSIFTNLTKVIVFIIGGLIILQALNISITPLLTALGVGGLAVALALQDTLSNLFAGIHVIAARNIRPGDYIKLDTGEEGYVVDITWRNTTIRALPNNMIIIPNSRIANAMITNYYLPDRELAVLVQVGIGYESDLEKVERVTIEVARDVMRTVPGGVPEFEPFIRYHTFGDFSINFTVILRAKEFTDQYLIKHEFIKRLHKRYNEEGIVIPFPIRTVYMKNEK